MRTSKNWDGVEESQRNLKVEDNDEEQLKKIQEVMEPYMPQDNKQAGNDPQEKIEADDLEAQKKDDEEKKQDVDEHNNS